MEISRDQAMEIITGWRERAAPLALHFAARGGTAGVTMLARVSEISSRLVLQSPSAVLRFGLYGARFALGPTRVLRAPSRAGLTVVDGLHIWLKSGLWLFLCDGKKLGRKWLASSLFPQPEEDFALGPNPPGEEEKASPPAPVLLTEG